MANGDTVRFAHRTKEDGTIDSICLACMATISTQKTRSELEREDEDHVCQFAFPSRRSGRLPAGVERGRRRSDAEWESFTREK